MIDYTTMYCDMNPSIADNILAVQAEGRKLAKLWKEDEPYPKFKAYDKRGRAYYVTCHYTAELAWLSRDAREDHDDFACVEYGPATEPLTKTQARRMVAAAKAGRSMLDFFSDV